MGQVRIGPPSHLGYDHKAVQINRADRNPTTGISTKPITESQRRR